MEKTNEVNLTSRYVKDLFNLDLLILNKQNSRGLLPVTNLNIFESSTKNFDPSGLFSTEIFGAVGSDARNTTFGYIELNTTVLHPLVFQHLVGLKALYGHIMAGKKYAKFNRNTGDFELATMDTGETGYVFFIKHIPLLKLDADDSDQRATRIAMIEKYGGSDSMLSRWLVLPAGYRDYYVDDNGVPKEDEVNDLYRKLMNTQNVLGNIKTTPSSEHTIDNIRYRVQQMVLDIYEQFRNVIFDGKHKRFLNSFVKRAVAYSTRNVITPSLSYVTNIYDDSGPTMDDTILGLFQFIKAITPITMNKLSTVFISRIFSEDTDSALLVNPDTLRSEVVSVSNFEKNKWLTMEGLEKIIDKMRRTEVRSEPVMVSGKYLLLVHDYRNTITPIWNTDNMDESLDKAYLRPITYYEMLYLAISHIDKPVPGIATRYPVIVQGSTYPSFTYVQTTENPRKITYVSDGRSMKLIEYPNYNEHYVDGMSVSSQHLGPLGGDFDGDKVSYTAFFKEGSVKEISKILNDKRFYLNTSGRLTYPPLTDTLEYVVSSMLVA